MDQTSLTRVLVAEDFADLALLYRQVISLQPDLELVEVATSTTRLMESAQAGSADVVVLDLHLAAECTTGLIPRLAQFAKVVVVSGRCEPELIQSLFEAGAHGYVPKTLTLADDLVAAIRAVGKGELYMKEPSPSAIGYF